MFSRNDPQDDGKAKRYFHLQKKYLAFKEKLNTRTRLEEIISGVPDLTSSTQDSSTATTAFSTPLFQRNTEKESLTPPPLNPVFLTPPLTVETPSQQGPKPKRRRIQFLNYLDDHNAHVLHGRRRGLINFHFFQIALYRTLFVVGF